MKTKLFTFLFALILSVGSMYASDTEVDGIWYDFDSSTKTATVTYKGFYSDSYNNEYSGSVTIPASVEYNGETYDVTSIGDRAFADCTGLTSVEIPNSVTSIGNYAFEYCKGLTSITIPNSVTSIGGSAFYACTGLTKVNITDIEAWCNIDFANFYSNPVYYAKHLYLNDIEIKDLIIPNSVTSIGAWAFRDCTGLTSVEIPNSVTSIGDYAFYDCTGLTSVTIPNSVTSIGWGAFYECTGLTSVTIPNSVTSIGGWAFQDCTSLTTIEIPNSVTSIGESAFKDCTGLTSVHISDITAWCTISFEDDYSNPLKHAHDLFLKGNLVTDLVISDGIREIGMYTFSGCHMTSVEIPNSVTSIGKSAFGACSGLTSIDIPISVTSIGDYTFDGCSNLTSVTIPNSVTSIGWGAFYGCSNSLSVTINSNAIVSQQYTHDYSLKNIFGNQVKSYIIGDSVTSIGDVAFYKCGSLTSVTIPNSVTSIGYEAFRGCSVLTSVTIPNSVTSIGWGAFYGCTGLTSVTIPNSVTSIGGSTFYACSSLTSVTIPNSVTSIGGFAFYACSSLTSIDIPNSVTSIRDYTFDRCSSLTSVTIGKGVKVLEENAFYGCASIETITCYSQRPPNVGYQALAGIGYSTIVYVPADYLETYILHDVWGNFDVRPISASSIQTDDIKVSPEETTATFAWPSVSGAATYELIIKDKNGNIVCTLIFNAQGQLTSISFAPTRDGSSQQAQTAGFSFTVTGLDEGTGYDLTITAKNESGEVLNEKTVSFYTNGGHGIDDVYTESILSTKLLRNGQIFILRGDRTYTLTGQEVK